jgi:hypothetical protein
MWDLWWTKWQWAGFLRVLRFPLPIFIPPTAPHPSSSIIPGLYNRPVSGRRTKWTLSHPTPRTKKNLIKVTVCLNICIYIHIYIYINHLFNKSLSRFKEILDLLSEFTKIINWNLAWVNWIHFTCSDPASLWSILIMSSHITPRIPSCSSRASWKLCTFHFSQEHYISNPFFHLCSFHVMLLNITWKVKGLKLLTTQCIIFTYIHTHVFVYYLCI